MRYWQVFAGVCLLGLRFASPAVAQTRVACVGDSITEGYGLAPTNDTYPAQLQAALGSDYDVRNFGVSGTTARKQGDKPYWNQAAYTQSTTFDPNVVLLMLGTNDAKPQNWDATAFRTDYTALIAQYHALGARVLIATPPRVFGAGAFDISPTTVADVLAPLVRELAPQVDAELVDIFVVTQDHSEWFPDTVHPNREGAAALAGAFAAAVQNAPQTESPAPTNTGATNASSGAPSSNEPPSSNSDATGPRSSIETGDSATDAVSSSSSNSNADSSVRPAPNSNPAPPPAAPPTAVVPPAAPPTLNTSPSPSASTTGPTSSAPTSNAPASNPAATTAADSGCSLAGGSVSVRLTGGAPLVGLALTAWGLRRKRRKLSRRA